MDRFIINTATFRILFCTFAVTITTLAGCGQTERKGDTSSMTSFIPTAVGDWIADYPAESYDHETIFDYMDGAGEVYRMYDYREMVVRRFENPGQPGIVVEIFDMGSPDDAYGIFSHSRENELSAPGQGAEYRSGILYFWKDKYFVSILTEKETPDTKEALYEIAAAIDMSIKTTGTKPALLECLPEENLSPSSVRFFHLYTSLNYHYYLSDENILELNENTDAVLGVYQPAATHLVCICYPDSKLSAEAYGSFIDAYVPEARDNGAAQTENTLWAVSELYDRYLILVFDAPSESYGRELIAETINRLAEI